MSMVTSGIGNEEVRARLHAALSGGNVHAALLVGPAHVGKTTAALHEAHVRLGRKVLPLDPDIIHIESAGGSIGIEQIQSLLKKTKQSALGERTIIISGADYLTTQAANALLVFAENPPAHTVLVLTASLSSGVLPTIRSRCVPFVFGPVAEAELEQALPTFRPQADIALVREALSFAHGLPGIAVRFLDEPDYRVAARQVSKLVEQWQAGTVVARMRLAASVAEDPQQTRAFLELVGARGSLAVRPGVQLALRRLARNVQPRAVLESFAMLPL